MQRWHLHAVDGHVETPRCSYANNAYILIAGVCGRDDVEIGQPHPDGVRAVWDCTLPLKRPLFDRHRTVRQSDLPCGLTPDEGVPAKQIEICFQSRTQRARNAIDTVVGGDRPLTGVSILGMSPHDNISRHSSYLLSRSFE